MQKERKQIDKYTKMTEYRVDNTEDTESNSERRRAEMEPEIQQNVSTSLFI